jgi:hypothetical protein
MLLYSTEVAFKCTDNTGHMDLSEPVEPCRPTLL